MFGMITLDLGHLYEITTCTRFKHFRKTMNSSPSHIWFMRFGVHWFIYGDFFLLLFSPVHLAAFGLYFDCFVALICSHFDISAIYKRNWAKQRLVVGTHWVCSMCYVDMVCSTFHNHRKMQTEHFKACCMVWVLARFFNEINSIFQPNQTKCLSFRNLLPKWSHFGEYIHNALPHLNVN